MAQKRTGGLQKLRYNMCKRSYNITSRTTCWSDFSVHGTIEAMQELCEVHKQMTYMLYTCVAGMPAEKLWCF